MRTGGATVTVFGSALPSPGEDAYEIARELGRSLAQAGMRLCNGGYGGTMEAAARGAREVSGGCASVRTIGVVCDLFASRAANPWIDDVRRTATLFERLEQLIALGDAYVVLPGGTGTLLELAAVLELTSKGIIRTRPIILLGRHWEGVLDVAREGAGQGSSRALRVNTVTSVEECVDSLLNALGDHTDEL